MYKIPRGKKLHKPTYFKGQMLHENLEKVPLAVRLVQLTGRTLGKDVLL